MRLLSPNLAFRESRRFVPETRTVAMPVLIVALMFGMGYFLLRFWDGPDARSTGMVEVSEKALASESVGAPFAEDSAPAPMLPLLSPSDVSAADFTPWLSPLAFKTYIQHRNRGHESSFWSRGNWIRAVEGRWRDGLREYRFALGTMARPDEFRWRHRLDLTASSFAEELVRHGSEGFSLRQSQAYRLLDGTSRFQAVWVKPD